MKTNSITGSSRVGLRDNDASASESLLGNNEHQPTKLNRSEMFSSLRDLSKPCGDGREIKVQFKAKSAPELNADSTADVHLPSTRNAEHVPEGRLENTGSLQEGGSADRVEPEASNAPSRTSHGVEPGGEGERVSRASANEGVGHAALSMLKNGMRNVGAVAARNLVSVLPQTAAREAVRAYLTPALAAAPAGVATAAGAVAAAAPIVQNFVGLVRDLHNGTSSRSSIISRTAMIATTGSFLAASAATGTLAAAAPALVAANAVYTPFRDLAQYYVQLKDNNQQPANMKSIVGSAVAYGVNQGFVSEAMDQVAGAARGRFEAEANVRFDVTTEGTTQLGTAALETHTNPSASLGVKLPSGGYVGARLAGFAAANFAGETLDELTLRGATALQQGNLSNLQISVGVRPQSERTWSAVADQAFTTNAARSTLFANAYMGAYLDSSLSGAASDAVVGSILGGLYTAFIKVHDKPQQALPDEERGIDELASTGPGLANPAVLTIEDETGSTSRV
ncbi:hypothetical protein [Burkholderia pseudomallei]|uniref:hypothetical protein n=1 Tax=Burkholderia pseudomallei TaxID=28450 RepID=UPI000E69C80A|nr:hypothetical protein [Burkholderia pseudomallei]MBG1245678.1 hypothetical protein [Burkholderia pseudomallei]RIV44716.1 hypothetical protein D2W70_29060 [Burkholderia pseudomallei]RIV58014.1 hypothetical protein D2W49_25360 [Burkholderia pseudomallei]RIV67111.1 hypothetical protein D2W72_20170 [Burkholderia pseudomallei]RIV85424.1 hypothetical protein D2V84_05100 [Burkholderia pseudomallei]